MKHTCLFLPDISGFTQFVKNTEIEHSRHITSELLELLIDQNQLDFTLAEIEGDALFYYKKEEVPSYEEILAQARRMHRAFHRHLKYYDLHRICRCGACSTASSLRLKFFVHCGPTQFIQVKNTTKPFGETVIEAHRLMKNSVPLQEYILFTDNFLTNKGVADDAALELNSDQYDGNSLDYGFLDTSNWSVNLEPVLLEGRGDAAKFLWEKEFIVANSREVFFETLTNFKYRHLWNDIERIEYNETHVNRAGERHFCIFPQGRADFETVVRDFQDGSWVSGERLTFIPGYKYVELYFLAYDEGDQRTRVRALVFGQPGPIAFLIKPVVMRKMKKDLHEMFGKLKEVTERM